MSSPFDYAKSVTHTKVSLYDSEALFEKEYVSFLVNRSLSNSPQTAFFADAMNQYPNVDKKLQYDFYMFGIPKQSGYNAWAKKQTEENQEHIDHLADTLKLSMSRAIELYKIIGPEAVQKELDKRGGR
jgi:hypothetical protein